MKPNKSIDGLQPRAAKKTDASAKPVIKKGAKKTPIKVTKIEADKEIDDIIEKADKVLPEEVEETKPLTVDDIAVEKHEQTVEDFLKPVQAFDFSGDGKLEESEKSVKDIKESAKKDKEDSETKGTKGTKPEKVKKLKTSHHKVRNTIAIIAIIIILILSGLICWAVFWGNDIIAKITGGQGNVLDLLTFVDEKYDPLKTDANGRTNILAFGTSGYDMSGDEGDGWSHAGAQLTDSIMMISLNQETGDIAMLSLPRDLKANPTCTATGKINEVYWCNGGGYDITHEQETEAAYALMAEVGEILGVDFQYYAHLNWGALVDVVDSLGGVTITLDEYIDDDWWTGAVYEPYVPYIIDGEAALGLARARHGTMGGDFSRGASQQKILIGIKDKVLERDLSITEILNLATILGDNLRTNFSLPELKSLAHLTFDFDFDSMRQISLYDPAQGIYYMTTGTLENEISYVFPRAGVGDYSDIQEYVRANLSNDPRSYEFPTILVLNASEITGLAAAEKTKLENEGYANVYIDNLEAGDYPEGRTLYATSNKPGTKALLEKFYDQEAETILPATVPAGYDFVIIINEKEEESQN